ncbi:MAG: GMC family oxidoreductase N-terminal domain-containing protein, partial [Steroidobacteraceae bacterium]
MIEDIADFAAHPAVECDVCIVGSGPVGLAIAMEFEGTPVRVVILESGGDGYESEVEALSTIESVGQRRVHQSAVRRRIFGGTSSVWSGRCVPFSAMDLQTRSWIAHSGWPIQAEDLELYLQRAGRFLEVAPAIYDDRIWSHLGIAPPREAWDPSIFSTQVFQASVVKHSRSRHIPPPVDPGSTGLASLQHSGAPQAEDLGERSRVAIGASRNIRLILHAHATEVLTEPAGTRATGVAAKSIHGAHLRVHATDVVLSCGGIENARLLLLSNQVHANGLGNSHDQVGRYLQDHHYAPVGAITGGQAAKLRRRLGFRWFDYEGHRHVYMTAVSLSSQRQRESGLTRATLFPFEHYLRPAAIGSAKRVVQSLQDRDQPLA